MVARQSQLFIPTLREPPADAESVSHKLLVRGGYIRQVSAGVWTFLPLGWKVHQKVVQIIREEMDAIGGQEMLMPVLTPIELWQHTKRDHIDELFRLQDRSGRHYVLPLTHEETVTFHSKEIASYRQLPQLLYHFSIKERDEQRSRGGLLRLREFIMKDAYSFDRDEAGLDVAFRKNEEAYHRMFQRVGLEYSEVEAESGMMGGKESMDFLAPAGSGENTLVTCENGDFAADLEIARAVPRPADLPDPLDAPSEIATPGATTIEALAEQLGIDDSATSKAMPVTKTDGALVLALVRGDDRLSVSKLAGVLESDFHAATDDEIRASFGAGGGSIGPVGATVEIVADEALREGQYVAGANRDGWHLVGVEAGRDYQPRFADIREPREGDRCARLRRRAQIPDRDRGRAHLQVRDALLRAARRDVPRRGRDGEAADRGQLRRRAGARDGCGGRAGARRERDHLAALDRAVRRARPRAPGRLRRGARRSREGGGRARGSGPRCPPRRPRRAPRREVRRRGPRRRAASRHRREEDARGRRGRRARARRIERGPRSDPRRAEMGNAGLMAKRRRYSDDSFGPTIERLMAETGTTYRGLADKADLSAGYLNHIVHGNRPVPSNDVIARIAGSLGVEPEHFREYRIRVITDKLEAMPELIDRLYKRLA